MRHGLTVLSVALLFVPSVLGAQADSLVQDSVPLGRDSSLVQRVEPGSRSVVPRRTLRTFTNDTPEHLFGLVPGVVLRGTERGLASASILTFRGGAPGQASVYIDGAPVRFQGLGLRNLGLSSVSVASATLTTGTADLSLTDFGDGVIEYVTRSGGDRFAGTLSAATDDLSQGVGYHRFEATLGGPLPLPTATWFVGVTVAGQESHSLGLGSADVPSYITAGTDTVVTRVVGGQTESVAIPLFVDQRSYDWGSELRGHARVDVPLGAGSLLSATLVANETQERFFPENNVIATTLYTGARSTSRVLALNWRQQLGPLRGKPLALRVHASLSSIREQAGLLETQSERASTDPTMGIHFETLRFTGADVIPFPLDDQLIRNVRTNSGLRVPYLNRDDLRNVQASRANPYGMEASWLESGLDGLLQMVSERRAEARWALDWEPGERHAVTVGGSFAKTDLSNYISNLLRQSFMEAFRSDPARIGIYVSDQFRFGKVRGAASVRFDHFESAGLFPDVPGRIYTHPEFNRPGAISSDTAYSNSLARVMTPGKARQAVSWQAHAASDVGSRATLRLGIGQWVEPPSLGLVLMGSNNDLDFTNTNDVFGRDVDYGRASLAEVGARVEIGSALVTDLALYHRSAPRYAASILSYNDPANPGDVVNVNSLTAADNRVSWGPEVAVDWNPGDVFSTRVVYSLDVGSFTTHAVSAAAVVRGSSGWLRGAEAAMLFRATSGYPYAQLDPAGGTGITAMQTNLRFLGDAIERPSSSPRLPWTSFLDVRVAKRGKLGSLEVMGFADFRNVLNLTNVLDLYAESRAVENENFRTQRLDLEFQNMEREAADNNRLLPNGDIDLIPNCASWTITGGSNGAVVNCVALQRVEARFGNGDGLLSLTERETALNTFFNAFYGPQTFYGAGRSVRVGLELLW